MNYLAKAIAWTVGRDQDKNITTEQVGVLKVMKLAAAIKAFEEQKSENGETTYTIGEIYEQVVRSIQSL
ncbi:hypothetical protein A0U40_18410 [[Bacillus] sp. KCTC 13219]|nr:hypothetical protein A0U40_18410 [[Bacillus] sp. KCTC 13219]